MAVISHRRQKPSRYRSKHQPRRSPRLNSVTISPHDIISNDRRPDVTATSIKTSPQPQPPIASLPSPPSTPPAMSVSSVSSEEMKAEFPVKKQLVKLNFNPEAQEEKDESAKEMGSGIDGEGETKIGWFRYYKAAELILTDVNGEKKTYVQHRWGKIPTPRQHRKTKSLKSPKGPKISKAIASPYGPSPHHLTAYIPSSPSATANAAQLTHHALRASDPPKTVNSPKPT